MTRVLVGFFIILFGSCSSRLDFTLENLNNHTHLNFTGHHGKFMSGHHDYDAGIIEFDLELSGSNEDYFNSIFDDAAQRNWTLIHRDDSVLILFKVIDSKPVVVKIAKVGRFATVKIE